MKMNSNLKKWSVLTLVAAATTLGLLSCHDKDEEKVGGSGSRSRNPQYWRRGADTCRGSRQWR